MSNSIAKEILRRYSHQIKMQIANKFRNNDQRKDVFQEVALHIINNIDKYNPNHPNANLAGWISRLVTNKCYSIMRENKKNLQFQDFEDESLIDNYRDTNLISEEFDPNLRSVKIINIEKLLLQLNARDREIIILRVYKSKSVKEIDEIMNLTNSAIYYKRAIAKLRELENADDFFNEFDGFEPA